MATLKQRLHRKNSSGSYDTVHLETSSSMVLRPNGNTVEDDLANYLPEVQDSDNVPESLHFGKLFLLRFLFSSLLLDTLMKGCVRIGYSETKIA